MGTVSFHSLARSVASHGGIKSSDGWQGLYIVQSKCIMSRNDYNYNPVPLQRVKQAQKGSM